MDKPIEVLPDFCYSCLIWLEFLILLAVFSWHIMFNTVWKEYLQFKEYDAYKKEAIIQWADNLMCEVSR